MGHKIFKDVKVPEYSGIPDFQILFLGFPDFSISHFDIPGYTSTKDVRFVVKSAPSSITTVSSTKKSKSIRSARKKSNSRRTEKFRSCDGRVPACKSTIRLS